MSQHLSVVMPVYNERYLVAESVRRVLAVESPLISRLDLIIVDDGSTDGTREILRGLAAEHPERIVYIEHDRNRGKGAAVCTAIEQAHGSVTVIQDADLEYEPQDLPRLMVPFERYGADAVFGSRFLTAEYRRVLYYRHAIGNTLLTTMCNLITDVDLTDMETCYKAVRTPLLKSIPIRSRDFRLEPELTIKLAKRGARIFEVPISYSGRTYEEGKKIGFRDALLAFETMVHWWLIDDMYKPDEYGSDIHAGAYSVPQYTRWLADLLRPHVGARVLEIGAGIGNLSRSLLPRDRYTITEVNPHYLDYLRQFAAGKPYMEVRCLEPASAADFRDLVDSFDTVLCLAGLERMDDERPLLANLRSTLATGGKLLLLVPQNPRLFGTLDEVLGWKRRYTRRQLKELLESCGFAIDQLLDFNRVTTPAWWLNSQVLKRRDFGKLQLKVANVSAPVARRLDHLLPWQGAGLVAVARRS